MKLYGTTTSPFVRRVRVVAAELGVEVTLVDTAPAEGQAALRAASPIWKVPVAEVDGRRLWDSRAIADWLLTTRGWGRLAPPRDPWAARGQLDAVDAALESAIGVFYLRRDGLDVSTLAFAARQRDRIASIFAWLGDELDAGRFGGAPGLPELSLLCTLDWMTFRDAYPAEPVRARFEPALRELAGWASVAATRPHT
jgi:glutathione S-transferase